MQVLERPRRQTGTLYRDWYGILKQGEERWLKVQAMSIMGYNFLTQHRNWNTKMARIYLLPVPLGHHLLQLPRGKYHIPVSSFYSFHLKHSWTVLWINYPSLCIRTKSLKNEVGALCRPQQTLNQALLQPKDSLILQRDSTYQNHIKNVLQHRRINDF